MSKFHKIGGHFLVDGQFGSTGKGLLGSWIGRNLGEKFNLVVSNAGPNSGHTFYFQDRKIVLKQLPTVAVYSALMGKKIPVYINSGAMIDFDILNREVEEFDVPVILSSRAVLIDPRDKEAEGSGTVAAVAGTRQGGGAALARKILRDPTAVVGSYAGDIDWHPNIKIVDMEPDYRGYRVFFEVSQGFSLGIHSHFYPKVTSRECTVAQALADARFPPQHVASVSMVVRTYPIRVSNFEGNSSGDCYPDQKEIDWDTLGVEPELTTVTKRVRRVFTFSHHQFGDAIYANQPDLILVNFMNYLRPEQRPGFADDIKNTCMSVLHRIPELLYGFGPRLSDIYRSPLGPDTKGFGKISEEAR